MGKVEAQLYIAGADNTVQCGLCPHNCIVLPGRRGRCGVRQNSDGTLYSLVYGELVADHIDPIEKKPLFHIHPGTTSLSVSTVGCNFRCRHCQNNSISQVYDRDVRELKGKNVEPGYVVERCLVNGCKTISYTYVEPTVFFEFAYDCCVAAYNMGLGNVLVSNGYFSSAAARKLAPYLSAINIDIKSFQDDFYQNICGAKLQPVLDSVALMKELGVWVEVTTLIIPGYNNSESELKEIASFLCSIDSDIPWHVSGFHPMYKLTDVGPTTSADLRKARDIGLERGLRFVYEGNMPGRGNENTYCPGCGKVVIERFGFSVRANRLKNGVCPDCNFAIPGVW